ncbi:MAG: UbiH/UbiF/VisC/COQ6 family ubiquinone biosynthesis hydroxylase [Hydrogenovibrio sp.]
MATNQTDVLISGGGPVGLLLAIGLGQAGHSVVLAEKNAFEKGETGSFDGRVLALTYGSVQVLKALNIWSELEPMTTPIQHVHVSQKGYLGLTQLHADEMRVPALGYSVTASDLGRVLWQTAQNTPNVTLLSESGLVDLSIQGNRRRVALITPDGNSHYEAALVVGADGTESTVRNCLNLPIETKAYEAFGVIAKMESEQHPNGWAFERFTEQGPVALLPMHGHESKAVWVVPKDDIDRVRALSDADFISEFTARMGERFGGFVHVSERVAYPLTETYVPKFYADRAVLMGNASHTQHPVAAQGLNLGIRDVAVFLERMPDGEMEIADLGDENFLARYAQERAQHHEKIMGLTDGLIQLFQVESPVVGHLRGLGLMAMNALPGLRKRFTKMTMGVSS